MCLAEEMTEHIIQNCLTVGMLRTYQTKEGITLEDALNYARNDILDMLNARIDSDGWLDFYNKLNTNENGDRFSDVIFEAATKGWQQGYVDGFVDRGKMKK